MKESIEEIKSIMAAFGSSLNLDGNKGDIVGYKHVDIEIGKVEAGGIAVQNVYHGADGKERVENDGVPRSEDSAPKHPSSAELSQSNYIFNPRIFNTVERQELLRDIIGKSLEIDMKNISEEDVPVYFPPNKHRIKTNNKNELYYLLQALIEAHVVSSKVCVSDFYFQMKEWFPDMFQLEEWMEEKRFICNLSASISTERAKWRDKANDVIIPLKDMIAENQSTKRVKDPFARRLYKAAYLELCVPLKELVRKLGNERQ